MLAKNHLINNDSVPYVNLSNNEKKGYCSLISPIATTEKQNINGLDKEETSLKIKINGYCTIKINDIILIFGKKMRVISVASTPRQELARKRIDFNDFQSSTEVELLG